MRDNALENFCVKLPGNLVEAFRAIAANKGDDPGYLVAQMIKGYVDRNRENTSGRASGVIEVYVKSLLNQWVDWPPAREVGADEFIVLTMEEIHKKLVVTEDQAKMVAYRVWQELRKAPEKVEPPADGDAASGADDGELDSEETAGQEAGPE